MFQAFPVGAIMLLVVTESYCMKTVMIHLVDIKAISYYLITKHDANLCRNSS